MTIFFLGETLAQDVVAKLQSSCLQARLAWLQVYRSKSSRQLRVWPMVLQIWALTQKLQDIGACKGGWGSCIIRSMPWTHLHLGSRANIRTEVRGKQATQTSSATTCHWKLIFSCFPSIESRLGWGWGWGGERTQSCIGRSFLDTGKT